MKRMLLPIFFSAIVLSALAPAVSQEITFQKIDKEVSSGSQAYESLREAVDRIGHRLSGTLNGEQAEEFAYRLFKAYGFRDVRYQSFEIEAWSRDTVTLSIAPSNSDNYREVRAVALAHTPVSAQVTGEIVDVGNGLAEDFEALREKVSGKIALVNLHLVGAPGKRNLHRSQKTALAVKYGAKAILFVNGAPGDILLTGTASVTGSLITIPALCISKNSGRELRSWAGAEGPMVAEIEMRNFSEKAKARNVIATLKGRSKERVVIGGHLDSWDLATGAIDNGIGAFAVLDIARTFQQLKIRPEKTIEFVLFMGEEQGLLGSRYYVEELKRRKRLDQIGYMINLDMTNNPNGVISYGRPETEKFLQSVGEQVAQVDSTYENRVSHAAGLHSDHQPFLLNGIPALAFSGTLPTGAQHCYHADCDHFNLVSKTELEKSVRVGAMYLYALSSSRSLPAKRLSSEETREMLIRNDLKESLILGNDWLWEK